ncbi:Initiation factor subunit 2 family protein [Trichostrongylus colubriformis]|uniref:Initiation factor subunit 2 family protein n=1 Tax=Trichostrongylus colubriformis TaxID=6319 RepID=A0AAN8IB50_TRICO
MNFVINGPIPADFMANSKERLAAYRFNSDTHELSVLDQLLLPHKSVFIPIRDTNDAFSVIRNMQVRSAPLIAVVGALGLLVEMYQIHFVNVGEFTDFIEEKVAYLLESRPTAINLCNALDHISEVGKGEGDVIARKESVAKAILKLVSDEAEENRRLIWNGYQEILSLKPPQSKFTVMTICNTESLATSSWGTALGWSVHRRIISKQRRTVEGA